MKTVLNIGTLPLPIGGVTIHLDRFFIKLRESELSKQVYLWDYKRESTIVGLRKIINSNFVHVHLSNKVSRLLCLVFCKILLKKTIVTYHGMYDFNNILDRLSLYLSNYNLVLNNYSYSNALSIIRDVNRVELISAFIPPTLPQNLSIESSEKISNFISKYSYTACTNAHSYVKNNEGNDLYGLDFLLKIFVDLPSYGIIIADPSQQLKDVYKHYLGIDNILFISNPEPFVEIISRTNVFIRATTSDGDSLSIKEAIYLNKQVMASDCVDRPEQCVVFKMYDTSDFINKLNCQKNSNVIKKSKLTDGSIQLIELYNSLLRKRII